jgi:CRP-like cAMP-binding protein
MPAVVADRFTSHKRNRLLASLPPADFSFLAPYLKEVSLEQGASLYEPHDKVKQVHFPQSGMISLLAVMQEGTAIEIATVGREGAVGAMSGLGLMHAFSRAVVQVPGIASRIATSQLQLAVNKSSRIRDVIVRYNEVVLLQIQQTAACNAIHSVEARLSRWLLQTRDRSESDDIPITQEFLSQMLGVQRTTVNLAARTLQKTGLVDYRRGRVEILNRGGLERKSCECYADIRGQIDQLLPPPND